MKFLHSKAAYAALSFSLALGTIVVALHMTFLWRHTPIPEIVGTLLYEFQKEAARAEFAASLIAQGRESYIRVPVVGVSEKALRDSYGEPRSGGRRHEGIDIFAPKGTYVVSATEGIVLRVGTNALGGNIVFVLGPGGERYYYAHLDTIDHHIKPGVPVGTSTLIGRVGTTGNATGTPPHLHFGVYGAAGAVNPFPRFLTLEQEKASS